MAERKLDRLVEFDERSRSYPVRQLVRRQPIHTKTWRCRKWLDQGSEGACVGFSWAHEIAASPQSSEVSATMARDIYRRAQRADEYPGEDYSGTSVIAGAKVLQEFGYMSEYRWAFGIDELIDALMTLGPAVLGIPWYQSMFEPRPSGLLEVEPGGGGGHAILARGVRSTKVSFRGEGRQTEPLIILRNSWGEGWGLDGDCYVRASDMERILKDQGEACIPVSRHLSGQLMKDLHG